MNDFPNASDYLLVRAAATRAGTSEISVSLSHCDEYATATALVTATSAADPGHEGSPDAEDAP